MELTIAEAQDLVDKGIDLPVGTIVKDEKGLVVDFEVQREAEVVETKSIESRKHKTICPNFGLQTKQKDKNMKTISTKKILENLFTSKKAFEFSSEKDLAVICENIVKAMPSDYNTDTPGVSGDAQLQTRPDLSDAFMWLNRSKIVSAVKKIPVTQTTLNLIEIPYVAGFATEVAQGTVLHQKKLVITSTPVVIKTRGANVTVTNEALDDVPALAEQAFSTIETSLSLALENAIINGDGNVAGILDSAGLVTITGTGYIMKDAIKMLARLWPMAQKPMFIASPDAYERLSTYAMQRYADNGAIVPALSIGGVPIEKSPFVPDSGLMLIDADAYALGVKGTGEMLKDFSPHVYFEYNASVLQGKLRVGGDTRSHSTTTLGTTELGFFLFVDGTTQS